MAGWHSNFTFAPQESFRPPPSWNSFTFFTSVPPPPPPLYDGPFHPYPSRRMPSPSVGVSFGEGQPSLFMPAVGSSAPDMGGCWWEPQLPWKPFNPSGRERIQPDSLGSVAVGSAGYSRHAARVQTEESIFSFTHHRPFQAITEFTEDYSVCSEDNTKTTDSSNDWTENSPKSSHFVPGLQRQVTGPVLDAVPCNNFTVPLEVEGVEPGQVKAAGGPNFSYQSRNKKCDSQRFSKNEGASLRTKETETQTESHCELVHKSSQTELVTGKRRLRSYDCIGCVDIHADCWKKEVQKLQIEVCSLRAEQCIKDLHRQMLMLTQDKTLWQTYFISRSETKAGVCDIVEERISWLHSEIHRVQPASTQRLTVKTLVKTFLDRHTSRLYALFLSFAIELFDQLNKQLQTDKAMVHVMKRGICRFYKKLLTYFVKPSALSSGDLLDVDFKSKYIKPASELMCGSAKREYLEPPGVKEIKAQFFKDIIVFCQMACTYLRDKFVRSGEPLWTYAGIADMTFESTVHFSQLQYFLKRLPSLLPDGATMDDLEMEFNVFKCCDLSEVMSLQKKCGHISRR